MSYCMVSTKYLHPYTKYLLSLQINLWAWAATLEKYDYTFSAPSPFFIFSTQVCVWTLDSFYIFGKTLRYIVNHQPKIGSGCFFLRFRFLHTYQQFIADTILYPRPLPYGIIMVLFDTCLERIIIKSSNCTNTTTPNSP